MRSFALPNRPRRSGFLALGIAAAPLCLAVGQLPPRADSVRRGPVDWAEFEAFIDGLIGVGLLTKGYRLADPATTLFRPGSITKLSTWTAAMQLVEAGTRDLDGDVNRYLDFQIPATFPQPAHRPPHHDSLGRVRVRIPADSWSTICLGVVDVEPPGVEDLSHGSGLE